MVDEQKLRELAEAATPGPWLYIRGDEWSHSVVTQHEDLPDGRPSYWTVASINKQREPDHEANAGLIAAANPAAILSLLDELQTLREERTAWRVTAENAEAAVKQAREDALEEAKKLVWKNDTAAGAAHAIESLKGKT